MSKIYVVVSGDEDYDNYNIISGFLDLILEGLKKIVIITGTEGKVEEYARQYASDNNLELKIIPTENPRSDCKPKLYNRQEEMLKCSERLIAFWNSIDGETEKLINKAKLMNKKKNIFVYS